MTLTAENYHSPVANRAYMGSTQFKQFRKCEAAAMAVLNGEWTDPESIALLVGSYVDAHFSKTLDLFCAKNPQIFKRDGNLKSDYEHANYIIERIERDKCFMAALSGQKQVIMTGEIGGVQFKVKSDSLLPDRIVDLKIMRDMADVYDKETREWKSFWRAWEYDIQGAIYREIVRQNIRKLLPFGLSVATKEKPEPDLALLTLPAAALDVALEDVQINAPYYDGIKKGLYPPVRCEKCDYCRSTKVLTGWVEVI